MYGSLLLLATGLTLGMVVLDRNESSEIFRRQDGKVLFEATEGMKNVEVYVSESQLNWGDVNPVDVIRMLHEQCNAGGCQPSYTVNTRVLDPVPMDRVITVTLDGDYPGWAKSGLAEIHTIVMQNYMNVEGSARNEEYESRTCGGMGFCASQTKEFLQHYAPERINVRSVDEGIFLRFDIDVENPHADESGCEVMMDAGAAINGAINGALGGAFGLASIMCGVFEG